MTTLTIQLPDDKKNVIADIADIIKKAGGRIDVDTDDLSAKEFEMLQEAFKEALDIKAGLKKGIPASELWND